LALPLHLVGGPGITTLTGGPLDDTLDGRGGAYTLIGGKGNDTYLVDNPGDVVTEKGGGFVVPAGWTIIGTTDLDKDGNLDVLATNGDGSSNQFWLLKNGAVASTIETEHGGPTWQLLGLIDFNHDGNKELLFKQ